MDEAEDSNAVPPRSPEMMIRIQIKVALYFSGAKMLGAAAEKPFQEGNSVTGRHEISAPFSTAAPPITGLWLQPPS
jgi:hypothetical protein